ncbi:MAG: 3-oxoacyl-ACP reductase [Planctomycetaceae bacterium]|nr:MAG: 3-oxoacyl-ACP reductase [Planctomycetaceae bacterium]
MDLGLTETVAVVTGGAQGIGWAVARLFAEEGCQVALWDISPEVTSAATRLQQTFARPCVGQVCDITQYDQVLAALEHTQAALGPIEHVVHAAAIGSGKYGFPFDRLHPDDWRHVWEVNVLGMVHVAHAVVPALRAQHRGTMVFVASVAGQIGSQTDPPYSASKAANINFAQCLARDLAADNIRVNTVCPGMVQTQLNRAVWEAWAKLQPADQWQSYEAWAAEKLRRTTPLNRWQTPEDVANLIVFLCSSRARQITGQTMNVDGGFVMHW